LLAHTPAEWLIAPTVALEPALPVTHDPVPAHRVAQLQAVYDGAPVGLCFLDKNMRYVNLNRRLAQMNNVPAIDHIGRTVAEVIPTVFKLVEPFIRRALAGEPVSGVEITKPAPPGICPQTLMLSYQPVRDEAGEVLGVSVAVMDISERKHAEEALREIEDHSRHLLQLHPHIPWVLDTRGFVVEASSHWTELTGQPMQEAMGDGWMKMLHPEDVAPTWEVIRHTLRTGMPLDIAYRVRIPGDGWQWMRSRGVPRFNQEGAVVNIYGVVEEIEDRKETSSHPELR
jgi:PAS domain S-box-containing protein